MFILSFSLENHLSFRDEAALSMVDTRLRTSRPHDGTWQEYTRQVAAVYGANASGKSALLDGLEYMRALIRHSATTWSERKRLPRSPFLLDDESKRRPSSFALDFVLDDVRYEYGFSVTEDAVEDEWLYYYPTGRKRVLFERDVRGLRFGRALGAGEPLLEKLTGPRELVLSRGAASRNERLQPIFRALTDRIEIANFGDADRMGRLRNVIGEIADGSFSIDDLVVMLRIADVGIVNAELEEEEVPEHARELLEFLMRVREPQDDDESPAETEIDLDDEQVEAIMKEMGRSLRFRHLGHSGGTYPLPSHRQSTGTLTWLSVAAPALTVMRNGGILCVDELDASLHPQLAQVLIGVFKDEGINRRGAQLIFTTHDTFFMSPSADVPLDAEEVWFVEKSREGVSELFSLSEFPVRADHNLARRYVQGRYGAVPAVAPSFAQDLIWKDDPDSQPAELETGS